MKYKSRSYAVFQIINTTLMLALVAICLYPFLYIFAISLSDSSAVLGRKITIFPVGFNLQAYKMVAEHPNFLTSYRNTILYTSLGTAISLFMTVICAYPLSKKHLRGRGIIMKFIMFTMFFGGGLIPNFIIVNSLHFTDNIWALVIPGAINQYSLILIIIFFQGLPESLEEAAAIDGLNPIQVLIQIVLPLSKPVMATVGLFTAVFFWDWFYSMIYMNSNDKFPVMLFLRNIVMGAELAARDGSLRNVSDLNVVSSTLKSSTIILVIIPIIFVYPFIQKYFVKGVMLGSLKG